MKNIYWLLLLTTSLVRAQLPVASGPVSRQTGTVPDIAQYEKQHYQRLGEAGQAGTAAAFTIASDNFDVSFYRCNWQLNPEVSYINGAITAYFTIKTPSDSIVFDLINTLTVDSVIFRSNKINFRQSADNGLIIKWPATLNTSQKDSVTIFYQGIPVAYGFGKFFQGIHRGNYAIWTLSEPYGAAGWWPCKNGLNDKADSLDIIVTIPEIYTPSSNGVLVSQTNNGGKSISYFKHRYPIATYLIALAIGKYNIAKDSVLLGDRQMPVLMYSLVVTNPDAYKPATAQAKKCLQKFSSLLGLYPFYQEQYCQTQWGLGGGGMEHQTNSFIVDLWPNLVAHELGHQWFGDKVTCGSWQDLWLNEGMATFVENLYYELYDPPGFDYRVANLVKSITNLPDGSVWVTDTSTFSRLFNGRLTYNKGCMVARMLRLKLGDSTFFKGLRTYLDDLAVRYGYARTADMKRAMEQVSGKNLESFFTKWIYGEGHPSYQLTWSQNINYWAKVKLSQTTSHPSVSFYDMPVPVQFKNATRDTIIVLDHQFSGQEFAVNVGFKADTVIIDPKLWLISKSNTSLKEPANEAVNLLTIYPNPAPDQLYISLLNPTDNRLSLRLLNSIGQLIYRKEIALSGNNELLAIPVQHLARGIYYLTLKSASVNITRKIMR
jgi:aminopeptidase N